MHSHANEFAPKWQRKKLFIFFYKLHHESWYVVLLHILQWAVVIFFCLKNGEIIFHCFAKVLQITSNEDICLDIFLVVVQTKLKSNR